MHDYLNIVTAALLLAVMVVCFAGCKAYYPTTYSTSDKRDSVRTLYVHDSVYIDRWRTKELKGDTVYLHDSIIRTLYQKIEQHDSIYINKCDTIYKVQTTKAGSTFLRNSGIALWVLLSLLLLSIIAGIILKFAK